MMSKKGSNAQLAERLVEIALAIANGDRSELTMRVPAQPYRDADLVLSEAAIRLRKLEAAKAALERVRGLRKIPWFDSHGNKIYDYVRADELTAALRESE